MLAVVSGEPSHWRGGYFIGVALELVEIVERIDAIQLAFVDQTHA